MNKNPDNDDNTGKKSGSRIEGMALLIRSVSIFIIVIIITFVGYTFLFKENSNSLGEVVRDNLDDTAEAITGIHSDAPNTVDLGEKKGVDYNIKFETGNDGTNANITLTMYSDNGVTSPLIVNQYLGYLGKNAFKANGTDILKMKNQKNIGLPNKIVIDSDNNGISPQWKLNKVVVMSSQGGESIFYPSRDIGGSEPGSITLHKEQPKVEYTLYVTSGERNGTDSNVNITIQGLPPDGKLKSKYLHHTNDLISGDAYKKGRRSNFIFTSDNLGDLRYLKIALEPRPMRPNDSWTITKLTIKNNKNEWQAILPLPMKIKTGQKNITTLMLTKK